MPSEPPFGIIWNLLQAGKVIPFLGAGASFVGRPDDPKVTWASSKMAFLPSGLELAQFLAQEASFPSTLPEDCNDLGKVASYYADVSGRPVLRQRLRELLNRQYQPGPLHVFLASLPGPQVLVVTNYDTLLEQAFNAAGKPYDLVVYPADRKDYANALLWWPHGRTEPDFKPANELDQYINLETTTVIFKMHGTLGNESAEWDNFVITEDDYVEFLSRMISNTAVPAIFFQHFRERKFLFLGYSLRDWNLRVVLRNINKDEQSQERHGWAIQRSVSELEDKLWERRGVELYGLKLDEFVSRLSQRAQP